MNCDQLVTLSLLDGFSPVDQMVVVYTLKFTGIGWSDMFCCESLIYRALRGLRVTGPRLISLSVVACCAVGNLGLTLAGWNVF